MSDYSDDPPDFPCCDCAGKDKRIAGLEAEVERLRAENTRLCDAARCHVCNAQATCIGSHHDECDDDVVDEFACDECCGHCCEDGHCDPLPAINPPAKEPSESGEDDASG